MLKRPHTRTRAWRARTHAHAHARTRTHASARARARTHAHAHAHERTHIRTRARAEARTRARTHARSRTHARVRAHARARTHARLPCNPNDGSRAHAKCGCCARKPNRRNTWLTLRFLSGSGDEPNVAYENAFTMHRARALWMLHVRAYKLGRCEIENPMEKISCTMLISCRKRRSPQPGINENAYAMHRAHAHCGRCMRP